MADFTILRTSNKLVAKDDFKLRLSKVRSIMNVSEQIISRGLKTVLESQQKNACVMLNDQGQEVHVTKAMVVSVCQQLLRQCRNIKN